MATIEHKNIIDSERHEPKGITVAAEGEVYVADGGASGTGAWGTAPISGQTTAIDKTVASSDGAGNIAWIPDPHGWAYYKDGGTAQVIDSGVNLLSIDGTGATSDSNYLPAVIRGSGELWDVATNKITPIETGDSYMIRIDLPVTAKSGTPTELTVELDIGGLSTPTIVIVDRFIPTAKSPPYTMSVSYSIFCLGTFVANGGQIFVTTDTGTLTVTNPAIQITRASAGSY